MGKISRSMHPVAADVLRQQIRRERHALRPGFSSIAAQLPASLALLYANARVRSSHRPSPIRFSEMGQAAEAIAKQTPVAPASIY
ncbi:MAG: hypothetical protein AAFR39_14045, partial [Pseudomonadota bacterium]